MMRRIDIIHVVAGSLVMIGILLTIFVNPWWALLPGFVGINLFQFGFSRFCPLEIILKRLGVPEY